jgi:5'-phosphate synthase pdxT subunit
VLAVQGDFAAHERALAGLVATRQIRTLGDLTAGQGVSGLVLPGGESTTMIRLLGEGGLWDEIRRLGEAGLPLFGTCAGAILLSREVEGPAQPSLGLLDATIRRNAYGRQAESFEEDLPCPFLGGTLRVVCIRAPRFERVGPGVETLLARGPEPLWLRQGRIWAATFHPELDPEGGVHRAFVEMVHSCHGTR